MRWIQISLLMLTLLASTVYAGTDAWPGKYMQPTTPPSPREPPPKKTPPPPSPMPQPTPDTEISRWSPATSWSFPMPDFPQTYAAVSTSVIQTDDRLHRSIWGWLSEYPILQFTAIILLSSAILAVARAWLRRCCIDATTQRKR